MSAEGLSPEVKQFLREFIHTIGELEILLLMRSQPARDWTAKVVFDVIAALIYGAIFNSASKATAMLHQFLPC